MTGTKKDAKAKDAFGELAAALHKWDVPNAAVDIVHDAARASLIEVKALTEYEDGKVSRLLTVIAFLSAVVAAVFTRFASDYHWPNLASYSTTINWWLPFGTYLAFFSYVIFVTVATFILLGAIKPTFNLPASWRGESRSGLPSSMLFYKGILDATALKWGDAFIELAEPDGKKLKAYYAKCYIGESYLVAEKVATKLRTVAPGVGMLRWSMGILIAFFVLFALTSQFVCGAH